MLLSNAFSSQHLSSLCMLFRKRIYFEECSFPGSGIVTMNSVRAFLTIKGWSLRIPVSSAACCANGWWHSGSLTFLLSPSPWSHSRGIKLTIVQLFDFSTYFRITLSLSMSKITKRKAPVDLDFTLRRVFGKTSFRYCLCDDLFAQDTNGPQTSSARDYYCGTWWPWCLCSSWYRSNFLNQYSVILKQSLSLCSHLFRKKPLLPAPGCYRPWHHNSHLSSACSHEQSSCCSSCCQHPRGNA